MNLGEDYIVLHTAPEPIHKIDDRTNKTVVVIGKEHFLICKQLMQDNANDVEFSKILNIPPDKVRYFRHKMQIFEDRIRARRRAARLNKKRWRRKSRKRPEGASIGYIRKKEMTAEERFRYARKLILENYTTSEISKVLRVSERSVTRFRKRLKEQKLKLQEEGKIELDPEESEEYKFKFLSADVKAEKIEELYKKGLPATEIAKILKISDRSVRRWRIRLDDMRRNPEKRKAMKKEVKPKVEPKKHYIKSFDREIIEKAKKMLAVGATNKLMCEELSLEMNVVRKLVKMILNGTAESLIDDTLELLVTKGNVKLASNSFEKKKKIKIEPKIEYEDDSKADTFWTDNGTWSDSDEDDIPLLDLKYTVKSTAKSTANSTFKTDVIVKAEKEEKNVIEDIDPLCFLQIEETSTSHKVVESQPASELKPKNVKPTLGNRDATIAKLLRDKGLRSLDIATLMNISERSVTRLMAKAREMDFTEIDPDIEDEVDKMVENRDDIANKNRTSKPPAPARKEPDDSKRKTGMRLLSMGVKMKDIEKMLSVSERTITRWRRKLEEEQLDQQMDEGTSYDTRKVKLESFVKEEPPFDDCDELY